MTGLRLGKERRLSAYWANTSGNGLADKLIREGGTGIKMAMEGFLGGASLQRAG